MDTFFSDEEEFATPPPPPPATGDQAMTENFYNVKINNGFSEPVYVLSTLQQNVYSLNNPFLVFFFQVQ